MLNKSKKHSHSFRLALFLLLCLGLSGCLNPRVPLPRVKPADTPSSPQTQTATPAPEANIVLPPRFLRPDASEIPLESFRGLFKNYDYIIVDGDPAKAGQEAMQASLLRIARLALAEGESQGLKHRALPVREPALCFEMLPLEGNPGYQAADASPSLSNALAASPGNAAQGLATLYSELLDAAQDNNGHLPLRGLSLPERVSSRHLSGAYLSPEERQLLPPVILPMPEDEERLGTESRQTMVIPAKGSSETAIVRTSTDYSDTRAINLANSAMAWHAVDIAHEDVQRPLFIVLGTSRFDRGEGLGEAIAYFDASSRVLQMILVDGKVEKINTGDGTLSHVLKPLSRLPALRQTGKTNADYIFVLIQPRK